MQRSVSGLIQLNQRNGIETNAIMSIDLKYIKKGPVLLKDTQKFFFCSTKADREKFFEEISSDLFEIEGFCFSTQATTTSTNVLCDT